VLDRKYLDYAAIALERVDALPSALIRDLTVTATTRVQAKTLRLRVERKECRYICSAAVWLQRLARNGA